MIFLLFMFSFCKKIAKESRMCYNQSTDSISAFYRSRMIRLNDSMETRFFVRNVLLLKPHANVRYRQSLEKLALIELECMLSAYGLTDARPAIERIAGEPFLTFETEGMMDEAWRAISRHSAVCFAARRMENGALLPIERSLPDALPDDLPHVLKYKGKTNADFTCMMLHCAKAASAFAGTEEPLTVLDPMAGKGTALFCALCEGNHAIGVETDGKSIQEADAYFARSMKLHKVKHKRTENSRTLKKGGSVHCISYVACQDAQRFKEGMGLSLTLINGDATRTAEMLRAESCHLVVCDLPYGVQHAPKESGGLSTLGRLLRRTAVGCAHALKKGGAAAFAFNLNTLRRKEAEQALEEAGLTVLRDPPYHDFSHWVEQAVDRDVVIAVRK